MKEKRQEKSQFINFLKESKYSILIIMFFIILAFGQRIISSSFSIDTEHYIYNIGTSVNWNWWLSLNRWGLVVTNIILQMGSFPIFVSNYLTVILMLCYSIAFNYLYYRHLKEEYKTIFIKYQFIFPILFVTSPIFAEQYNFLHQNVGVALGILMIPCSLLLHNKIRREDRKIYKVICHGLAIIMAIWSFGTYQSMILLYIVTVAACYLLEVIKEDDNSWKFLGKEISWFTISMLGYWIICQMVGDSSSYLQMAWKDSSFLVCIKNILYCVKDVLKCNGIFYHIGYLLAGVSSAVFLIYLLIKKRMKIGIILGIVAIMTAPFYIMIITGVDQLKRTQFNYSYVIGFIILLTVMWLVTHDHTKIFKNVMLIAVLVITYRQAYTSANLFHTTDVVYQGDVAFANRIVTQIQEQEWYEKDKDYTLIFVGRHSSQAKDLYQKGEIIGASFFDFDYENIWGVNQRANVFLSILGYPFKIPTEDEFNEAKEYVEVNQIKPWPNKEAVILVEDKIIVRLSEEM